MNGRLYDPLNGRMLSVDNYANDAQGSQGYNRYTYANNNPLRYTDPDGEWVHLAIGAAIGGVVNWAAHGAKFTTRGLGYFAVGALVGALSAGIGAGVSSLLGGGAFSAGFLGTSTALTATSSFISGAAIGASGGFTGGFVNGLGNGLVEQKGFNNSLKAGLISGLTGALSGGLVGGVVSGIQAALDGRNFFDGYTYSKVANQNIPIVGQRGDYNCAPACGESISKSRGCNVTQEDIRSWMGGDPNKDGMNLYEAFKELGDQSCGVTDFTYNTDASFAAGIMRNGGNVIAHIENAGISGIGHAEIVQSITMKVLQKASGQVITNYNITLMNPANGGFYTTMSSSSFKEVVKYLTVFH